MDENMRSLAEKIEDTRIKMHEVAKQKGLLHIETVQISRLLDSLILEYQKLLQQASHTVTYTSLS